jgi:hypothetical protein
MRPIPPNPFRRVPYLQFPFEPFMRLVATEPLEAKAVLDAAVADGSVFFPHGTSEHSCYGCIVRALLARKEHDTGEDTPMLKERYAPMLALPSESANNKGFPYAFVCELLERLAQGEHPLFFHESVSVIRSLFESDPGAADDKLDIGYRWITSESPR